MDSVHGCQRMPPFSMTDAWSLRGILGQEGCGDNEMQDVETKAEEEGNTADCTLARRRKGRQFVVDWDEEKCFYVLRS